MHVPMCWTEGVAVGRLVQSEDAGKLKTLVWGMVGSDMFVIFSMTKCRHCSHVSWDESKPTFTAPGGVMGHCCMAIMHRPMCC